MVVSELDKSYAAAYMDADGCISISNYVRKGGYTQFTIVAMVTSVTPGILEWFKDNWGGSVYWRRGIGKQRDAGQWFAPASRVEGFLRDIRPYMKIKSKQCDVALAARRLVKENHWATLTVQELDRRTNLIGLIHQLNQAGL